jgi:hypothetical protein
MTFMAKAGTGKPALSPAVENRGACGGLIMVIVRSYERYSAKYTSYFKMRLTHQRMMTIRQRFDNAHSSFTAHDQPPAIVHPAKAAFDFPPLAITRPHLNRASTLRLVPLADSRTSLFLRHKATIEEGLRPFQLALGIQLAQ